MKIEWRHVRNTIRRLQWLRDLGQTGNATLIDGLLDKYAGKDT